MKKGLIIANGAPVQDQRISELATNRTVMALDGAYDKAKSLPFTIDFLLGDFDSIRTPLDCTRDETQIIHTPNQNKTDLDKGVDFFHKHNIHDIRIIQATGNRLDHTLHNIQFLSRHFKHDITLHTQSETLFCLQDTHYHFHSKPGYRIAIFAAPECTVTSQGLKYDMTNAALKYDGMNSGCNHVMSSPVSLDIKGKAIIIYEDNPP